MRPRNGWLVPAASEDGGNAREGPPALAILDGDGERLREAAASIEIRLAITNRWDPAIELLETLRPAIVFYDLGLAAPPWREALVALAAHSAEPCVVVVSKCSDINLRAEVIRLGGWDLLRHPFDRERVRRILLSGLQYWSSRQAMRETIAGQRPASPERR
jgi:FixJ family two-component response regulator